MESPHAAGWECPDRGAEHLKANFCVLGWSLTPQQMVAPDTASARLLAYPYWHQVAFPERNPLPL